MDSPLTADQTAATLAVLFAIAVVLTIVWIWGLVRLFTGNHTAWGVLGIFISPFALAGFLLAPQPGSSRYERLQGKRLGAQAPVASLPPRYRPPSEATPPVPVVEQEPRDGSAQLVLTGTDGERIFDMPRAAVAVGRGEDADLRVDDAYASSQHAVFEWEGGYLRVRDLGSTNGTDVNGDRLIDAVNLEDGDVVRIGKTVVHIRLTSTAQPSAADTTVMPVTHPVESGSGQASWRSVFISYASEDQAAVHRISSALQAEGWQVWFDQHDLQPGQQWGRRISAAVAGSSVVLAVVSPATLQSQWVDAELQLARNSDRPILGLVVERTSPQAIQERLGLYLGRQLMDFSEVGEWIGGSEVEDLSLTLDALARGASVKPRPSPMRWIGTTLLVLGIAGLVASIVWMVTRLIGAFGSMGEFFDALAGRNPDPDVVTEAWREAADAIISSAYVMPAFLASLALLVAGVAFRRAARRKALQAS